MIGDFEYTIDEKTSKSDLKKWSALVSESGCQVEFIPPDTYPVYKSRWQHLDFGNVCINYICNHCPMTAMHIPDVRQVKQNMNFKLVYTDSDAMLSHYERLVKIPAESFVLLDNAHPFEFAIESDTSVGISMNLHTGWLLNYIPNPKLSVACPLSAQQDWGKLLLMSLKTIVMQENPEASLPRSLIAEQLGSLLSLLFLPKEGANLNSRHQVSLYSHLNRILHDNFHMAELNPEKVAVRAGISKRHLFNVFSAAGTTFNKALLEIRLQKAREMFLDQRYRTYRICDVAWACGFSDLSHFGKRFKQAFLCSPLKFRKKVACETNALS